MEREAELLPNKRRKKTRIFESARSFADAIFPPSNDSSDMKALLVDDATLPVVSMSFGHSNLLERNVFLIEKVGNANQIRENKLMSCIIFIRPDDASLDAACEELQRPKFKKYRVVFCCAVCPDHLDRLAYADSENVVEAVIEIFCDFVVVTRDAFLIERSAHSSLFTSNSEWSRIAEGIASFMVAQECIPVIRFQADSEEATRLATELSRIIRDDSDLYCFPPSDTTLIIGDRQCDPLTPLLLQWGYQEMLHEHIGIDHGTVKLSREMRKSKSEDEAEELVVSLKDDALFEENMYETWGKVCVNLNEKVTRCREVLTLDRDNASFEVIQALLNSIPENRALTETTSRHVSLAAYMTDLIRRNDLLEVSMLEQHMCTDAKESEHWTRLEELSKRRIDARFIFHLCLIYNLRYEDENRLSKTKAILDRLGDGYYQKLKDFRRYCGRKKQSDRLFTETNVVQSIFRALKPGEPAKNPYALHQPYLKKILLELFTNKLDSKAYRIASASSKTYASTQQVKRAWVFMCGGYTYSEASLAHSVNIGDIQWEGAGAENVNDRRFQCVLGGDKVLHSSMFLNSITSN